jgi:hypothetical protein
MGTAIIAAAIIIIGRRVTMVDTGMQETRGIMAIAGGHTAGMAPGPFTGTRRLTAVAMLLSRHPVARESDGQARSSRVPGSAEKSSKPAIRVPEVQTSGRTSDPPYGRPEMHGDLLGVTLPGKTMRHRKRNSFHKTDGRLARSGAIVRTGIS